MPKTTNPCISPLLFAGATVLSLSNIAGIGKGSAPLSEMTNLRRKFGENVAFIQSLLTIDAKQLHTLSREYSDFFTLNQLDFDGPALALTANDYQKIIDAISAGAEKLTVTSQSAKTNKIVIDTIRMLGQKKADAEAIENSATAGDQSNTHEHPGPRAVGGTGQPRMHAMRDTANAGATS